MSVPIDLPEEFLYLTLINILPIILSGSKIKYFCQPLKLTAATQDL